MARTKKTDTDNDTGLRIVHLQAQNTMRLRAVEIIPEGDVIVLGGRNAQGKSAVLRTIEIGLRGMKAAPPEPVHAGEHSAEIILDLGDFVIERSIKAAGKGHELIVRRPDGTRVEKPQAVLDALYSARTLDALEFARLAPAKQAETLRALVGLDFAADDQARATLYDERTQENRALRDLEGKLREAPPKHHPCPAEPVSIDALTMAFTAAVSARDANARAIDVADSATRAREVAEDALHAAQKTLALAQQRETAAMAAADAIDPEGDDAAVEAARAAMGAAEATNQHVRENQQRAKLLADIKIQTLICDQMTADIDAIDQRKRDALAAAPWPVPGLGFDDDGTVTLNGHPLEQASQAETIRLGVAIGAALNPRLKILLVHDGSLLDPESMAALVATARDHGCQLWIEDARTTDPAAVIIEDGAVKDADAARLAKKREVEERIAAKLREEREAEERARDDDAAEVQP